MKKKSNKIVLYFLFLFIPLAVGSYFLLTSYALSTSTLSLIYLAKDFLFVGVAAAFLYYVLGKKEASSSEFVETLKRTDDEIKESNERYDIVAKATSDTIWGRGNRPRCRGASARGRSTGPSRGRSAAPEPLSGVHRRR